MDPTVVLPLHFTIEAVVLTAAALVLAWAALRRQWLAATGALILTVAQALHAGYFAAEEGEAVAVVLRLAGIAGLAFVLRSEGLRSLFGAGLAAIAIGTLWGAVDGGASDDFAVLPHLFLMGGAIALLVWVSYATRPSVRLRVIAAFVSVLAVAVVVAGGAIARVAALDSRTDQYTRLGVQAVAARNEVRRTGQELSLRAAANSPALSAAFESGNPSLDTIPIGRLGWAVLFGRDGAERDRKTGAGAVVPYSGEDLVSFDIFRGAQAGRPDVGFATTATGDGLIVVAAAPVYLATDAPARADVLGVLVLGRTWPASQLGAIVPGGAEHVAVRGEASTVSSDPRLPTTFEPPNGDDSFRTVDVGSEEWFAAVVQLPGGNVFAMLAAPDDVVVDATTDLVRAFLVAILAAALLAVIAALWLSSRITRPMLELADDAERVKSDFLASVSHELRTPLTPIRGYTELLRRGVPARSRTGYLDEIGNATQRLERIVSLLVDVAAMDAGRYRIAEEDVGVRDLFASAKERWSDRKTRIEVRLPKGELQVRADAAAISRVLDELIDNAFKFHPDGIVELRARRVRDRVELSVADRGPGIDPERLAALRTPFATGERGGDTKRYGGLGLGLSFVEGVLRAHGTQLSVATGPGEGTTCVFTLPAAGSVTAMPARTGRSGEQARRAGPSTRKPASRKR